MDSIDTFAVVVLLATTLFVANNGFFETFGSKNRIGTPTAVAFVRTT
ncbi:hypothetical protein HMPREF9176_0521 [Streptococcus downei F0415]|nr:hypothetical protein HMPREF9176_0521 [Streptococcus downei F0415]